MKIVGYQIILRITRFVTLVIRPDYQKFCLRSTPEMPEQVVGKLVEAINFQRVLRCLKQNLNYIIILKSVAVRKLHIAIFARSSREMSQTVRFA